MRGSLIQIFATPGEGGMGGGGAAVGDVGRSRAASCVRLRQLVVELKPPTQRRVGMSQACGSGTLLHSFYFIFFFQILFFMFFE